MDEVKSTYDIDLALEATAGVPLGTDTVAIFYPTEKMYGVYVKGDGEALWWLKITALTLDGLLESKDDNIK